MKHSIYGFLSLVKQFNLEMGVTPENQTYISKHYMMSEENNEYLAAAKDNDPVEVADAIGDMFYILCGTILKHNLEDKIPYIIEEIHRSNMSKIPSDGEVLREPNTGKVLKPDGYFPPNLVPIVEAEVVIYNSVGGTLADKKEANAAGLVHGNKYLVEAKTTSSWLTLYSLIGFPTQMFNSVQFKKV